METGFKGHLIIKVREDGLRYIATVSVRDGLDIGDLVQGEVRFPAGTPAVEKHATTAKFEVVVLNINSGAVKPAERSISGAPNPFGQAKRRLEGGIESSPPDIPWTSPLAAIRPNPPAAPSDSNLGLLGTIECKERIFFPNLPQTIQDAVTVTRRLNIRYLWVDALCIIQDSLIDKAIEIDAMGEVYKNAVLTIAATSAVPSIDNTWALLRSMDTYKYNHEAEPLETRDWALQEALLSPRLLSFGERELSWRCQIAAVEVRRKGNRICKRLPSGVFGIALDDKSTIETRQELVWEAIVEDYSSRELTVPQDRLPAIAGIASELARLWEDTSLAGMWKKCLVKHLAWERVGRYPETKNIAPSWSWASPGSGVAFHQKIETISADVTDCQVEPLDERASFGQVKDGRLVLRALSLGGFQGKGPSSFWRHVYDRSSSSTSDVADVQYILLGQTLEQGCIGLILEMRADGKYVRTGIWSGFRVDMQVWSGNAIQKAVFEIV
ncbi:HET-domain-containing protein [Stipitochalara longipes BDJ]|nr:HET-domain-containing protein [Stipitochalara longipes BDJ]